MNESELIEVLKTQCGRGWLGVMEVIDYLNDQIGHSNRSKEIIEMMQKHVGQHLLSNESGCDERAVTQACNECIELVLESIKPNAVWFSSRLSNEYSKAA